MPIRKMIIALLFVILISLSTLSAQTPRLTLPDFETLFKGIDGTFLLYDEANDQLIVYNPDRAQTSFTPYSTFKILNSMISLETGAIDDVETLVPFDPETVDLSNLTPQLRELWGQDHTMRTAIRDSVVWFYVEMARRVGQEQMQASIDLVGYGNQLITGWIDPVPFWLGGDGSATTLEITPYQQMDFIRAFYHEEFEFSQRTYDLVKDILIRDETDDYRLSAKTGGATLGWYVGYVEVDDRVYYFVLNLDQSGQIRIDLTYAILREMGIIPREASG